MKNILVVEDDNEIRDLIVSQLKSEGYSVEEVSSGEIALQKMQQGHFDLVVLDWMLPGLDGLALTKTLKAGAIEKAAKIPILMVTAKAESDDIIRGLESGADDYVTKPFDLAVLKARVKALLRRGTGEPISPSTKDEIRFGELTINVRSHDVHCQNEPVSLTLSEFKLLTALAQNRGRVLTRDQLINLIQGDGVAVIDRTVDTHVFGLRKKLGSCAELIETIRGVGYRIGSGS
ncbi:MAG: response regulator transcription factor [Bdellovibrionales bacterium]